MICEYRRISVLESLRTSVSVDTGAYAWSKTMICKNISVLNLKADVDIERSPYVTYTEPLQETCVFHAARLQQK